jgi:hypothetical protein
MSAISEFVNQIPISKIQTSVQPALLIAKTGYAVRYPTAVVNPVANANKIRIAIPWMEVVSLAAPHKVIKHVIQWVKVATYTGMTLVAIAVRLNKTVPI